MFQTGAPLGLNWCPQRISLLSNYILGNTLHFEILNTLPGCVFILKSEDAETSWAEARYNHIQTIESSNLGEQFFAPIKTSFE